MPENGRGAGVKAEGAKVAIVLAYATSQNRHKDNLKAYTSQLGAFCAPSKALNHGSKPLVHLTPQQVTTEMQLLVTKVLLLSTQICPSVSSF